MRQAALGAAFARLRLVVPHQQHQAEERRPVRGEGAPTSSPPTPLPRPSPCAAVPARRLTCGEWAAAQHWGFAFYFYDLRKHYAARLAVELRINVLQTDTDVVWLANPYPAFKTVYAGQKLITMSDRPLLNAGVFYTQNVHSHSP